MKKYLFVLMLGMEVPVAAALLIPQVDIFSWSYETIPLFLIGSFLAFWFLTVYQRTGLVVDFKEETMVTLVLIIITSCILDLFDLDLRQRLYGSVFTGLAFSTYLLGDYSLSSEKNTVMPQT